MTMASDNKQPAAAAIRAEIARHRKSVMVLASGAGPLLDLLERFVSEVDARIARLEGQKWP
jgi:hypothetical protein